MSDNFVTSAAGAIAYIIALLLVLYLAFSIITRNPVTNDQVFIPDTQIEVVSDAGREFP